MHNFIPVSQIDIGGHLFIKQRRYKKQTDSNQIKHIVPKSQQSIIQSQWNNPQCTENGIKIDNVDAINIKLQPSRQNYLKRGKKLQSTNKQNNTIKMFGNSQIQQKKIFVPGFEKAMSLKVKLLGKQDFKQEEKTKSNDIKSYQSGTQSYNQKDLSKYRMNKSAAYYRKETKRKKVQFFQKNQNQNKQGYKINVINMANYQKNFSQPKKITINHIDKFYEFCTKKMQNSIKPNKLQKIDIKQQEVKKIEISIEKRNKLEMQYSYNLNLKAKNKIDLVGEKEQQNKYHKKRTMSSVLSPKTLTKINKINGTVQKLTNSKKSILMKNHTFKQNSLKQISVQSKQNKNNVDNLQGWQTVQVYDEFL